MSVVDDYKVLAVEVKVKELQSQLTQSLLNNSSRSRSLGLACGLQMPLDALGKEHANSNVGSISKSIIIKRRRESIELRMLQLLIHTVHDICNDIHVWRSLWYVLISCTRTSTTMDTCACTCGWPEL